MPDVEMTSNVEALLKLMEKASDAALEIIGGKIESYAKGLAAHPKALAPELRNSITHMVDNRVLSVGSNMEIAPYIELGTGPNYEPPPEWMEYDAEGGKGQAGIPYWVYYDELEGVFKIGTPQPARPFLRPAFMDHLDEYKNILERTMKDAPE